MIPTDDLLNNYSILDLSFKLQENIPYFPTHAPFKHIAWETPANGAAYSFGLFFDEHSGTHVDATKHFPHTGRRWIDQIPIGEFIGPSGVVDCRRKKNRELVSVRDLKRWEEKHSKIHDVDALLFNYGWGRSFRPLPSGRAYLEGWPGLSPQAAKYIVNCGVRLVGCDTISIDPDGTQGFPAHHILLSEEVKVVESLANLDAAPPVGGIFMAVPLKIAHGSASPVRAFMLVQKRRQ
jgi:kynurenine formamidase